MCFPVNFQKHLFFKEHFQWLFLPAQETETEQLESCGATKFITTGLMITLKRNYLFEFHLPNTLLYFHFQNVARLHFHPGFHYAHSQMKCLLHFKINWWFHLPHKKLDLNVWNIKALYQGKVYFHFLCHLLFYSNSVSGLYVLSSIFEGQCRVQYISKQCHVCLQNLFLWLL